MMLHTLGLPAAIIITIARVLIGFFYIASAVVDSLQWQECLQLMESKKIPFRPLLLVGEIGLKFLGGLAILSNVYLVVAAILLIIFTLIANVIFNSFWQEQGKKAQLTFVRFFSYLAIVSSLLLLIILYW